MSIYHRSNFYREEEIGRLFHYSLVGRRGKFKAGEC